MWDRFQADEGRFTSEIGFGNCVPKKKPKGDVPSEQLIPPKYREFSTDVVERRVQLLDEDTEPHSTLIGGIRISKSVVTRNGIDYYDPGTLGTIVRDPISYELLLLTCGHVAKKPNGEICQPGIAPLCRGGCILRDLIGWRCPRIHCLTREANGFSASDFSANPPPSERPLRNSGPNVWKRCQELPKNRILYYLT